MAANVSDAGRFSRGAFPFLADFLRGYLHQDYRIEHGTVIAATKRFVAASSPTERFEVAGDLRRFLLLTHPLPFADVKLQLQSLGAAWTPRSRLDLERILGHLSEGQASQEPPPDPIR